MITRRHFLEAGVAAAVAAALPSGRALADAVAPRALVDWHSHYVSKAEVKFLSARKQAPRVITDAAGVTRLQNVLTVSAEPREPSEFSPSDIEARIANLDKHGVQRQLLTQTVALGLDATLSIDEQRKLYREFNDELAGVVEEHRSRFFGVAALPSADPKWAAEELDRAHRELGLIGGSLPLNAFSTLEGARTLAPLFKVAQKHRSHIFIHRGPASDSVPGQPPLVVPTDTAYARWSLISNTHLASGAITLGLTDFLDDYPDVSVEIIMLGGFLPHLIHSIVPAAHANGVRDPIAKLRRLYLDPGPYSVRNAPWVKLTAEQLGADRILFGTDYGVGGGKRGDVGPALDTLDSILSASERRLIYFENSRALIAAKGWA
jgi:predicted TIM-barrel fold metal-dependent hydrolase